MLPARALDAPQNCLEMDGLKLDNLHTRERAREEGTPKKETLVKLCSILWMMIASVSSGGGRIGD